VQPAPPAHLARPLDDGHVVPLRPLGLGDLISGAFKVVVRAPRPVLLSGAATAVVAAAVPYVTGPWATSHTSGGNTDITFHPVGMLGALVALLAVVLVQSVTAQVTLCLTAATRPDPAVVYRRAVRLLPLLLAVELARIVSLVVLGWFVVGIYLAVQWALAGGAIVAEGAGVMQALRRSAELIRGSWWRVLGFLLIAYLMTMFSASVLTDIASLALDPAVHTGSGAQSWPEAVVHGVLLVPASAFGAAFVTLLYVDLRCRNEGLAWKLDAARRGPERDPFGATGVYAAPPWRPRAAR